jgi:hypothetical protein
VYTAVLSCAASCLGASEVRAAMTGDLQACNSAYAPVLHGCGRAFCIPSGKGCDLSLRTVPSLKVHWTTLNISLD